MKYYTLLSFFLLPLTISAQIVKIKKQDVFVNDSPYCKIIGKTGISAAFSSEHEFTIASLEGKELINVKRATDKYLNVTFLNDGSKMKIKKAITSLSGQKDFIKKMYNANLLEEGEINNTNREFFLEKIEDKEQYNEVVQANANGSYNVVERSLTEPIEVYENSIDQDNVTIATFVTADEISDGVQTMVITFYLPNGTKAAKLEVETEKAAKNNLLTFKDNVLVSLTELSGDMGSDKFKNVKATALWLIKRGYL
ncbi:hypothetical protein ACQ33O_02800 [Ferruginibacter sp. SUN002]|uniref:hypothetical protein n=1 Tax=Ferruginibacter sp. SUN002 TaxID=2937789 RepID=UPI003D364D5F